MDPAQSLVALAVAVYVGAWLHEGSHYLIGWIGRTGPRMEFSYKILPAGVRHERIETMDAELIRMTGFSIFVWIPVGLLTIGLLVLNPTPAHVLLAGSPITVLVMATESDAIAARNPEKYRELATAGKFSRNPLFLPDWLGG